MQFVEYRKKGMCHAEQAHPLLLVTCGLAWSAKSVVLYGVVLTVAQDLSRTKDGGTLDVVQSAEVVDGGAELAGNG